MTTATIDERLERLQREWSAESLFEEGRRLFDSYPSQARFFLSLAGRLYDGLGDAFNRKLVTGWYKSASHKIGNPLSDDPSVWYNK